MDVTMFKRGNVVKSNTRGTVVVVMKEMDPGDDAFKGIVIKKGFPRDWKVGNISNCWSYYNFDIIRPNEDGGYNV